VQIAKMRRLSKNGGHNWGSESRKTFQLKKLSRTRSHPGVSGTSTASTATVSTVLIAAMRVERRRCAASYAARLPSGGTADVSGWPARRSLTTPTIRQRPGARHTLRRSTVVRVRQVTSPDALKRHRTYATSQRIRCLRGHVVGEHVVVDPHPDLWGAAVEDSCVRQRAYVMVRGVADGLAGDSRESFGLAGFLVET
jgi:hypothetical protein